MDLLIGLVHKINTRTDRRVERELTEDLRRVRGEETILFRLAEAAVEHPDDTVREALFPVVGEKTLRELVREARANERVFQERVRTVLHGSYSSHYRRMLPPLLSALRFRCDNTAYRPVRHALELLHRYARVDGKVRYFADSAAVPLDGVVLLLCVFALGTNMGVLAIVATGEHGESEAALRHVRRHFITRDNLRRAIAKLVNATFEARDPAWWGAGTARASDSKKIGSRESNLVTEWHQRYGGPGVMIYWHVERRSTCIYS